MKTKIGYVLFFILITIFGCNNKNSITNETGINELEKPKKSYFTDNQIQDYINKEINVAIDLGNQNIIKEAADVISLTRSVITSIVDKQYGSAIENIDKAIAKAKLITLADNGARVVSEVNIEVLDKAKDAEKATKLINNIDSLVESGELQKAQVLLTSLTSELRITRESISISNYLKNLKNAEEFLKNKQYENAIRELNSVLGDINVERSTNPLPLIIAEKLTDELEQISTKQNWNKQDFQTLLNNLKYEVRFSKLLGYGKTEQGYDIVLGELNQIENNFNEGEKGKVKNQIFELDKNLKNLHSLISAYKQINKNIT